MQEKPQQNTSLDDLGKKFKNASADIRKDFNSSLEGSFNNFSDIEYSKIIVSKLERAGEIKIEVEKYLDSENKLKEIEHKIETREILLNAETETAGLTKDSLKQEISALKQEQQRAKEELLKLNGIGDLIHELQSLFCGK